MSFTWLHKRARAGAAFLSIASLLYAAPGIAAAHAATGYDALDDAAIAVKNPGRTPLVAIARAGQRLVAVGVHGVIVTSQDNGRSWVQASVPVDVTLTSVYFTDARTGFATGHYGVVLRTDDAGASWTRLQDGLDVINALNAEAAREQTLSPPAKTAALMERVATVYQADGPSKPFLTLGTCGGGILAAGQQDMALFGTDTGKSWQEWTSQIDNPHFSNIYGLFGQDGQTILVGENGMVLSGDAGCGNFASLPPPSDVTLFGGMFVNAGTMLVYGLVGSVYKSADKGADWQNLQSRQTRM